MQRELAKIRNDPMEIDDGSEDDQCEEVPAQPEPDTESLEDTEEMQHMQIEHLEVRFQRFCCHDSKTQLACVFLCRLPTGN